MFFYPLNSFSHLGYGTILFCNLSEHPTMRSFQKRWPKEDTEDELRHKIGECLWWLIVLSDRLEMNAEELLWEFLVRTKN